MIKRDVYGRRLCDPACPAVWKMGCAARLQNAYGHCTIDGNFELRKAGERLIVVEDGDIAVLSDAIRYLDDHQHVIRYDAENYNKIWEAIHTLERWKKQLEASQ